MYQGALVSVLYGAGTRPPGARVQQILVGGAVGASTEGGIVSAGVVVGVESESRAHDGEDEE